VQDLLAINSSVLRVEENFEANNQRMAAGTQSMSLRSLPPRGNFAAETSLPQPRAPRLSGTSARSPEAARSASSACGKGAPASYRELLSIARRDKGAALQVPGRNEVHIAPDPRLSRLNRAHERVFRMLKVPGCVLVLRRVAAADIPTFKAESQMDPPVTGFHAFFTNMLFRGGDPDPIEMFALRHLASPRPLLTCCRTRSRASRP